MAIVTLTPAADEYIKAKIAEKNALGFRLSVKKTGCSGYSYNPTIIDQVQPQDVSFESEQGVKIYLDSAWLTTLQGVEIDYHEENKAGLKQKRLTFHNPNESSRCGCGESFHLE